MAGPKTADKNPHGYAVGQKWLAVTDRRQGRYSYETVTIGRVGRKYIEFAEPGWVRRQVAIGTREFYAGGLNVELFRDRAEADQAHAARKAWSKFCDKCVAYYPPPNLTAETVETVCKILGIELPP